MGFTDLELDQLLKIQIHNLLQCLNCFCPRALLHQLEREIDVNLIAKAYYGKPIARFELLHHKLHDVLHQQHFSAAHGPRFVNHGAEADPLPFFYLKEWCFERAERNERRRSRRASGHPGRVGAAGQA